MRSQSLIRLVLLGLAALLLFPPFSQTAKADNILDFGCLASGATACTGKVQESVTGNFSSVNPAGIGLFFTGLGIFTGFYGANPPPFVLKFDTATAAISLTGTGGLSGEVFTGTINSFTITEGAFDNISLEVLLWNSLPADVVAAGGFSKGTGTGSVLSIDTSGNVISSDVPVAPTPEPGTLALIGSGLLGVAAARRRKRNSVA